jgi:hypothetical protein
MKREQTKRPRAKAPVAGATDGLPEQGVSGSEEGNRIDLQGAVTGEYRFQGTLIRAFYISGCTWFVAAEVCQALELTNSRMMVKSLDPDERGVSTTDTLGGQQDVNLITESALYVLIFKSRKPQARAFRRWVTGEVLPQIRQTGAYSRGQQIGQDGSINLPPIEGFTRYVVVGEPGEPPHIRRTGPLEMLTENTSLDVQGLCYAIKGIEVWWNKLQIHRILVPARPDGFSALQVEKAIFDGSALADRYLGLMTYLAAGK